MQDFKNKKQKTKLAAKHHGSAFSAGDVKRPELTAGKLPC
jgi:hypothetical protein